MDLESDAYEPILSQHLLINVIEQLKLPLLSIARRAELHNAVKVEDDMQSIRMIADTSLTLLDSYMLGVKLAGSQIDAVDTEPVSVAAVLHDAGEQLFPVAKAYGVTLDLQIDGKYGPVMAHRLALQAALVSLGYALVEALPAQESPQLQLRLSAHRCRYGLVAGMYCDMAQLSTRVLRLGRMMRGRARQPVHALSQSSAAGIFVADAILNAMHSKLTVSRHRHMNGLGVVLPLNPQLQLV